MIKSEENLKPPFSTALLASSMSIFVSFPLHLPVSLHTESSLLQGKHILFSFSIILGNYHQSYHRLSTPFKTKFWFFFYYFIQCFDHILFSSPTPLRLPPPPFSIHVTFCSFLLLNKMKRRTKLKWGPFCVRQPPLSTGPALQCSCHD